MANKSTNSSVLQRIEAAQRFKAVAALVELQAQQSDARFPHLMPDGTKVQTWTEAAAWCAQNTGRSPVGIWRIWKRFKTGGRAALIRRTRSDKGTSHFFRCHPMVATFAAYLHVAWTRNTLQIFHAIEDNQAMLGLCNETMPSYETLRKWLRSTPQSTLIREALRGQRSYRGHFSTEARRTETGSGKKSRRHHGRRAA